MAFPGSHADENSNLITVLCAKNTNSHQSMLAEDMGKQHTEANHTSSI